MTPISNIERAKMELLDCRDCKHSIVRTRVFKGGGVEQEWKCEIYSKENSKLCEHFRESND